MKIIKKIRDTSEPIDCECCREEFNGVNYVILELFKDFNVDLNLCDNCLNELKTHLV